MKEQKNIIDIIGSKIPLRRAYKFRFYAWTTVFLFIGTFMLNRVYDGSLTINNTLRILSAAIILIIVLFEIKLNIEKGDELSNLNVLRAGLLSGKIITATIIAVGIFINIYNETLIFVIRPDTLFYWILLLVSSYNSLQCVLFMSRDRCSETDEDEMEDE